MLLLFLSLLQLLLLLVVLKMGLGFATYISQFHKGSSLCLRSVLDVFHGGLEGITHQHQSSRELAGHESQSRETFEHQCKKLRGLSASVKGQLLDSTTFSIAIYEQGHLLLPLVSSEAIAVNTRYKSDV